MKKGDGRVSISRLFFSVEEIMRSRFGNEGEWSIRRLCCNTFHPHRDHESTSRPGRS